MLLFFCRKCDNFWDGRKFSSKTIWNFCHLVEFTLFPHKVRALLDFIVSFYFFYAAQKMLRLFLHFPPTRITQFPIFLHSSFCCSILHCSVSISTRMLLQPFLVRVCKYNFFFVLNFFYIAIFLPKVYFLCISSPTLTVFCLILIFVLFLSYILSGEFVRICFVCLLHIC